MGVMWILTLILIGAVVYFVYRGVSPSGKRPSGPSAEEESAEEILRRRYARGEIDERDYEHRLEELRHGARP